MPRRIKDKNKSIFLKFKEEYGEKEIHKFLESLDIQGTKVSTLINRWVLEVPFWREVYFVEKLNQSEMVDAFHENFKKIKYEGDDDE